MTAAGKTKGDGLISYFMPHKSSARLRKDILRVIDANLNRAREGLRVCEEILRFILADAQLTGEFRNLRHAITRRIKRLPRLSRALIHCRDSRTDVGKRSIHQNARKDFKDVFYANIQRAKESLRVIEEFAKVLSRPLSKSFSVLRFRLYELEKKAVARF